MKKIYFLYDRYDNIIARGTVDEIAKERGIKPRYLQWLSFQDYSKHQYKKRYKQTLIPVAEHVLNTKYISSLIVGTGLSTPRLAKEIGITSSTIYSLLRGQFKTMQTQTETKFCDYFDVTIDDIYVVVDID